jgi:hypothetical protein
LTPREVLAAPHRVGDLRRLEDPVEAPQRTLKLSFLLHAPAPATFTARTCQVSHTLRGKRREHFHEVARAPAFFASTFEPLSTRTS